jgi:DNA-binding NarL/FixJ family response regulator
MADTKRILLVGHCLPDRYFLTRVMKKAAPEAEVEHANTDDALHKHLEQADALFVNRVLDGHFADHSGIDLIRELLSSGRARAAVLISNYEDAQREAEEAGALPGFGKAELGRDSTRERIRTALGLDQSSTDAA